jgi:hypothetical protein
MGTPDACIGCRGRWDTFRRARPLVRRVGFLFGCLEQDCKTIFACALLQCPCFLPYCTISVSHDWIGLLNKLEYVCGWI